MQSREEGAMFKPHADKWVYFLFEGQIDANAHGLVSITGELHAFVGSLHQSRPPAGDDVAAQFSQALGNAFGFFIGYCSWLGAGRSEDSYPVAIVLRRFESGQIVDYVPKAED